MSACAGSLTNASRSHSARRRAERLSGVRPGYNSRLFLAARARFSRISPAWSRWIARGRIGFMSTQRRDGRSAPTTETGRRSMRHGSRLALCKDLANRANRLGHANAVLPTWIFPAFASGQTAYLPAVAVPSTLQQDTRSDTRARQDWVYEHAETGWPLRSND